MYPEQILWLLIVKLQYVTLYQNIRQTGRQTDGLMNYYIQKNKLLNAYIIYVKFPDFWSQCGQTATTISSE